MPDANGLKLAHFLFVTGLLLLALAGCHLAHQKTPIDRIGMGTVEEMQVRDDAVDWATVAQANKAQDKLTHGEPVVIPGKIRNINLDNPATRPVETEVSGAHVRTRTFSFYWSVTFEEGSTR